DGHRSGGPRRGVVTRARAARENQGGVAGIKPATPRRIPLGETRQACLSSVTVPWTVDRSTCRVPPVPMVPDRCLGFTGPSLVTAKPLDTVPATVSRFTKPASCGGSTAVIDPLTDLSEMSPVAG